MRLRELRVRRRIHCAVVAGYTARLRRISRLVLLHIVVGDGAVAGAALGVLLRDLVVGGVWGYRDDVPGV